MVNVVSNVVAGKPLASGGVLSGPVTAPLPTDVSGTVDASILAIGYISDEGVTENAARDTNKIKAWGGDVVKITSAEHSLTYQYSMIEVIRKEVNEEVYGEANVAATAASSTHGNLLAVKVTAEELPHKSRVLEIRDGDARIRIVLPDSQITEVGEISYQDDNIIMYPVTVEAFPDSDGVKAYKYMDDGKTTGTP